MSGSRVYDYLIVGAGSSGGVLAARLTEDPDVSVLLLESGPDFRSADAPLEMRSANPLGITNPVAFAPYQWPQLMVRRTTVQEPKLYDRGRGSGGSSSINWMVAHRGLLEDYDIWAEQGCAGWSGEELLPSMIRMENDLDFGDMFYHGNSGPLTIWRYPIWNWGKVDLALLQAGLDLGYPWCPDLNAPGSTGIAAAPVNRTPDARLSTNDAYLEPARERDNLFIQGDTHVDRVLFDGKRAIGVRAYCDGEWRDYHAREVVLSAGSVFSPPILIRSGIGRSSDLKDLGIDVVSDLPVGQNLTDHSSIGIHLQLKPEARATSRDDRLLICYIRYSSGLDGTGENDMMIASRNQNGYNDDGFSAGSISGITWQNFSRGELTVTDADPFAMPVINENMLSDERDLLRLRDAARRVFAIGKHPAVQSISDSVSLSHGVTGVTALTIDDINDDRTLDEWMMLSVRDTWHLVGTCRMGAPDDPRSVVDPECRVLGVTGLRVVDGSIMPEVPRANTNLTCMLLGEHMAPRMLRSRV